LKIILLGAQLEDITTPDILRATVAPPPHSAPTLAGTTTTGRVPADITGSQNIHSNMATQHILLGITAAVLPEDTATTPATKVASTDEDCLPLHDPGLHMANRTTIYPFATKFVSATAAQVLKFNGLLRKT